MKITDTSYLMQNMTDLIKPNTAEKSAQDFAALLKKSMNSEDEKRLYQACQDLESVLMSKVLHAMRQTIPKSVLMGDSFAMDTFESMLFDEYSKMISKSNTLGIAEIMYRQLSERIPPAQPAENAAVEEASE